MELLKIKNLTFQYSESDFRLKDISFSVSKGEFLLVVGESGSGKSTLLKLLKKEIAPFGKQNGTIEFFGKNIGYVSQNIESNIVTDKVFSELAFSLENEGMNSAKIALKISETASFFNIQDLFEKDVTNLSGGEKKILSLACATVLEPDLLILDEPISCLDPMASERFLNLVKKINQQLGISIIMVEHNFENVLNIADDIAFMSHGKITEKMSIQSGVEYLKESKLRDALPVYARLFKNTLTVKDGKEQLKNLINCAKNDTYFYDYKKAEPILIAKNIYFTYSKKSKDVIKCLNYTAEKGKINTILGGNGCGKSTLLKIFAGVFKVYSGKIKCHKKTSLMPQNVKDLFTQETVEKELNSSLGKELMKKFDLDKLAKSHPYDLSGGEMEKLAFAKILMTNADIILLDEPTQGLDASLKKLVANIMKQLCSSGKTVILVSHDIEFVANISDNISLLFNGEIVSSADKYRFLSGVSFYTSDEYRISKGIFKNAVDFNSLSQLIKENADE